MPHSQQRQFGCIESRRTFAALGASVLMTLVAPAAQLDLPAPAGGGRFGTSVTILTNGNIVVTDPGYDVAGASDVGAAFLYDGLTLALISTLTGSASGDQVGGGGVVPLPNGNFVVRSPRWNNARGAATWVSGITGATASVSATNSLVGTTPDDLVGTDVIVLSSGNYLVGCPFWDNGSAMNAGAVTWASGTQGVAGAVSPQNSLVGSSAFDQIGRVTPLANGNYVVVSPDWSGGRGAVCWGSGLAGVRGVVSAANSLVGTLAYNPENGTSGDYVGSSGVTALKNGNYVVSSPSWTGYIFTPNSVGAVTWGNGNGGTVGEVAASNSLVGEGLSDYVGSGGVVALANGNYVVKSPEWASQSGAVTWGNGASGVVGRVSFANSLVGYFDEVGKGGVLALPNGNYVVNSWHWSRGGQAVETGAVTWGDGTRGVSGSITVENSLIGGSELDTVGFGGVTVLSNGNYVVISPSFDGALGAVTWCSGSTGRVGLVSIENSLVGSARSDLVGLGGVTPLANGDYVVASYNWGPGAVGAVTWSSGANGMTGTISPMNSLVGTTPNDWVGSFGLIALRNGGAVVRSPYWDNGNAANAGAITWLGGPSGATGVVSAANSLVGSTANDFVGLGAGTPLENGACVVASPTWDNGPLADAGAVSWLSGVRAVTGVVSAANSLVGTARKDVVGSNGVTALSGGRYLVRSPHWANGPAGNAGAVTWGEESGAVGAVDLSNSVVGSTANDLVGALGLRTLTNGNVVLRSASWNNGVLNDAGAVTLMDSTRRTHGAIGGSNGVVGLVTGGGDSLVSSYDYNNGRLIVGDPAANRVSLFAYPTLLKSRLGKRPFTFPNLYEVELGPDAGGVEYAAYAISTGSFRPKLLLRNAGGELISGTGTVFADGAQSMVSFVAAVSSKLQVEVARENGGASGLYDVAIYPVARPSSRLVGSLSSDDPSTSSRTAAVGSGTWYYDDYLLPQVAPEDRIKVRVETSSFAPFIELRLLSDESPQRYADAPALEFGGTGAGPRRDYIIRVTSSASGGLGSYVLRVEQAGTKPEIWGFSPASGAPGTWVTVRGTNFFAGLNPQVTSVRIGETPASSTEPVGKDSWDELDVLVPEEGRSGFITVATENSEGSSTNEFVVIAPVGRVRAESGNRFSFGASNTVGGIVNVVEATTDLSPPVQWLRVGTNTAVAPGVWRYTNSVSGAPPRRFFRVRKE